MITFFNYIWVNGKWLACSALELSSPAPTLIETEQNGATRSVEIIVSAKHLRSIYFKSRCIPKHLLGFWQTTVWYTLLKIHYACFTPPMFSKRLQFHLNRSARSNTHLHLKRRKLYGPYGDELAPLYKVVHKLTTQRWLNHWLDGLWRRVQRTSTSLIGTLRIRTADSTSLLPRIRPHWWWTGISPRERSMIEHEWIN